MLSFNAYFKIWSFHWNDPVLNFYSAGILQVEVSILMHMHTSRIEVQITVRLSIVRIIIEVFEIQYMLSMWVSQKKWLNLV